jgi:hypothetical protein
MSKREIVKVYLHNGFRIQVQKSYWDIPELRENPNLLYVFGDNTMRVGTGGQAIVRYQRNAIGISTKESPADFMSDRMFDFNKHIIDKDIKEVLSVAKQHDLTIVLSAWGYGTGLAMLEKYAPKTWEYLNVQLIKHFGYSNPYIAA